MSEVKVHAPYIDLSDRSEQDNVVVYRSKGDTNWYAHLPYFGVLGPWPTKEAVVRFVEALATKGA